MTVFEEYNPAEDSLEIERDMEVEAEVETEGEEAPCDPEEAGDDADADADDETDVEAESDPDGDSDLDPEDAPEIPARFTSLGLSKDALDAVKRLGYETPTPVQEQAIPIVLSGRDLIAAASTGTGKTAAFLLPLLSNLPRAGKGRRAPRILVVTPTRELAQQITHTCIKIARATGHYATTVYGGTPYGPQVSELRGGTDVLIATPGRLNDLMERKVVDLSAIEVLVLDEADRMLDMGFLPDVTTIVEALPTERQTLLFSATVDKSIEKNLGSLLDDPALVQISHKGETAKSVTQYIMPIAHKAKPDLLKAVLDEKGHERVIVFARTRMRAEECAEMLREAGYSVESIHSDKTQGKRRRALADFRKGRVDVLVATDVLARGIDVPSVDYVINYDLPDMAEDYIHRVGRTGRAGEKGFAISFVSASSRKLLNEIERLIGREIPVLEIESYDLDTTILKRGDRKPKKSARTERSERFAKNAKLKKIEQRKADEQQKRNAAKKAQAAQQGKSGGVDDAEAASPGGWSRKDVERSWHKQDGEGTAEHGHGGEKPGGRFGRGDRDERGGRFGRGDRGGRFGGDRDERGRGDERRGGKPFGKGGFGRGGRDERREGGRDEKRGGKPGRFASRDERRDEPREGGRGFTSGKFGGKGKSRPANGDFRGKPGGSFKGAAKTGFKAGRKNDDAPHAKGDFKPGRASRTYGGAKPRPLAENDPRSFGERKFNKRKGRNGR